MKDIEDIYKDKIVKVVCINKNDINAVSEARKLLEDSCMFEIESAENYFCEINKKGISKGKAVLDLVDYLGINITDVICIGDSGNDIEMLKVAGLSIAMGNAEDRVKEIADYVTDINNNSGIGKAIKKL